MHNPKTYIEFDPFKAKLNRAKHGVSFAQAEEALHDFMAVTIEDPTRLASNASSRWGPMATDDY